MKTKMKTHNNTIESGLDSISNGEALRQNQKEVWSL